MPPYEIPEAVTRIFAEKFTAQDIAEPLASFDADTPAERVRAALDTADFNVAGVRRDGQVVGFVERQPLAGGRCGDYLKPFDPATLADDAEPLPAVIMRLDRGSPLFIRLLGQVGGIVTTADLQKPPVRMWLFGIVTMVELRWTELIARNYPHDAWTKYLSPGRLEKAHSLLHERRRRDQSLNLLDCLQLADKARIMSRSEAIRGATIFSSRKQAEEAAKQLEQVRNNLAHAQDILTCDWGTIVRISQLVVSRRSESTQQT